MGVVGGDLCLVCANRDRGQRKCSNCTVLSPYWLELGIGPISSGVSLLYRKNIGLHVFIYIYTCTHIHVYTRPFCCQMWKVECSEALQTLP
jgi:hypothetical protein